MFIKVKANRRAIIILVLLYRNRFYYFYIKKILISVGIPYKQKITNIGQIHKSIFL